MLCFHDVSADPEGAFAVSVTGIGEILDKIGQRFISLDEALSGAAGVVLTFDDGYESVYKTVFPALKEKGYPSPLISLPTV